MTSNPVGWFEIYVSDLPRAKKFYETVFQKSLEKLSSVNPDFEMWGFPGDIEHTGARGTICKMKGFEPGKNSTIVYFSCKDCAIEEKRVVEAGGRVQKSKMNIGHHGYIAMVN